MRADYYEYMRVRGSFTSQEKDLLDALFTRFASPESKEGGIIRAELYREKELELFVYDIEDSGEIVHELQGVLIEIPSGGLTISLGGWGTNECSVEVFFCSSSEEEPMKILTQENPTVSEVIEMVERAYVEYVEFVLNCHKMSRGKSQTFSFN